MTAEDFWNKVKSRLSEQGKTFVWLCEKAGVSVQIMKNRIYKNRIPDVDDTLKLFSVLGVTIEDFYGVQDKFPSKESTVSGKEEGSPEEKIPGYDQFRMCGDSMEPTISSGDTVFCDNEGYQEDGIYAVVYRGNSFVKRLQMVSGGMKIISDNPAYEPILAKSESGELKVIGRAHYVLHRL